MGVSRLSKLKVWAKAHPILGGILAVLLVATTAWAADTAISALADGNPAAIANQIPVNQAGTTRRITVGSVVSLAQTLFDDTSPSAIAATSNDYTGCDTIVCRLTATGTQIITGISESQVDGTVRVLRNVDTTGADGIWLLDDNGSSSTAANRFELGDDNVLIPPGNSFTVVYDGTLSRWVPLVSDESNAPMHIEEWFTSFCFNVDDSMWDFAASGTGAGTNKPAAGVGVAALPCLLTLTTGTIATNSAGVSGAQVGIIFGGGQWHFQSGILVSASLSSGTERYTIRTGFGDSATTEPTDGCYIRYVDNVNSGNWQGVCRNNSTESTCDTTVVVAVSTFYELDVKVNAAGTSAGFCVNNTCCASNITTNIPTTAARDFAAMTTMVKSIGTTARIVSLDFMRVRFERAAIM